MLWKSRKPRKLTLVVITEANSPVRRVRIPRPVLWVAPVLMAAAVVGSGLSYVQTTDQLRQQIHSERELFRYTSESKDETIDKLQHEMVSITEEADRIRDKLEELRHLEEEVKRLSNVNPEDKATPPPSTFAPSRGGENHELSGNRLVEAASEAHHSLLDMHRQMDDLSDKLTLVKSALEEQQRLEQLTPSIWPAASRRVTSGYGFRSDPFTLRPSFHSGLDIDGNTGDTVFAAAAGTVAETGWDALKGNYIRLQHTKGLSTVYMHLSAVLVEKGDEVTKGMKIGGIGSTGRSTGSHLHYEVEKNGQSVDPRKYLPR
jgi:murein DD-endopeptidase MepM/ murein hydrolase activator NlpD